MKPRPIYKDRDDLVRCIHGLSRGHHFEPHYKVEETQILKAFQAYLAQSPTGYVKGECEPCPPAFTIGTTLIPSVCFAQPPMANANSDSSSGPSENWWPL